MNVLEKAEKSLQFLKNNESSSKSHELQTAASTLGRCLGALGSKPNYARHYANLLQSAIPTLLSLASNESAEVRLVGDEVLNRAVVGGFAFHSYKTNIILQNQIEPTKNSRWIRAALSRICLGDCWLRPGQGKIRAQAQTLFPKLVEVIRLTRDVPVVIEAVDTNLPRILNAFAEYTTDQEIDDVCSALLSHVESLVPSIRHGVSSCVAQLCLHREEILTNVLHTAFEKLWPLTTESATVLGWFSVIKAIFQVNDIWKFTENDLIAVQDYLELYQLCIHYLEHGHGTEHNIQNTVLECLTVLLTQASGKYRKVLLEKRSSAVCLDNRHVKGHKRHISSASGVSQNFVTGPLSERESELCFTGALHFGSLSQLNTPSLSVEDLTIHTPDSPISEVDLQIGNQEELTKDLSEKLLQIEETDAKENDEVDRPATGADSVKVDIGSLADEDTPLKYCSRLIASKFLLTGNRGETISDRSVRVSVKASALNCMSEIMRIYPQAVTMYLDKNVDVKSQNVSGSSEVTESQDCINEFILERNVCYQDSLTDSLSQDLLNRSIDSPQTNSQPMSKKDSKSLDKSMDSVDQKSSLKDVQSNILDSKVFAKNELVASGISADSTNPNMTNSNFTTNSNMTGSNDPMSTGYPMTSSGDVLSSSIDLDMKFDHFGESGTNLDNLKYLEHKTKRPLKRTDEVHSKDTPEVDVKSNDGKYSEKEFEFQHMSDIFVLLEGHSDPQIRGLVRVCIASYLNAALDMSHGDFGKWRNFSMLPKDICDNLCVNTLVHVILKSLSDEFHSAVNHGLSSLARVLPSLCTSAHCHLVTIALNSLIHIAEHSYWLCKVNLCSLYEHLPYDRLFMLLPDYHDRSKSILTMLIGLLRDHDQKVRNAAANAITNIIPVISISRLQSPSTMLTYIAVQQSDPFIFDSKVPALDLVRHMNFYCDLPEEMKGGKETRNTDNLKRVVGNLVGRLFSSNCKYFSQGLLESLVAICKKWPPWKHPTSYHEHGLLSYCIQQLDSCSSSVSVTTLMVQLCCMLYPVEIESIMRRSTNRDIFERDTQSARDKWQHLDERVGSLAKKFLQITLKMLNLLVHLIEEVHPNVHLNRTGIALPGSPVRRKTQDSNTKKPTTPDGPETGSLKRKPVTSATNLKANLAGNFYNEPFYMKLYESLRAVYNNHKINLDPKSSMFYDFMSSVLNALAMQLELATEKEFGMLTEEILFYLKLIMPLCADKSVYCVTQLLKCLFSTNMINQYDDFTSIIDKENPSAKPSFYNDVLLINKLKTIDEEESLESSISSNASQRLSLDTKNPRMVEERNLLMSLENFIKNKSDRKWSTNKKELERYIRLFEPVVIQALKSYTMQNDIPLQRQVLLLLNQLLTLRVNYCMLDSDQVFIGFLMKQLDLVEQHEIPECCTLVNSILMFLVQLSSSKHHTKQIIEIPKLIQLCDGLLASGAHVECIAGLEPVAVRVFSMQGNNVLGRAQQQEAQATREVLFYMLQKTMNQPKVLKLVSCVLVLSQSHGEQYCRWSELAADTLFNLLAQNTVELNTKEDIGVLEKLVDCIYKDVLLDQNRVELLMKILFKAPPDQGTTSYELKLRYLTIVMVLLRKILVLIPESEILLTINYLKSTCVSPQSIFFNVKTDIDPLHVQNVNENCANLSPDVILVRFLFKTLTYAITEVDECQDAECMSFDSDLKRHRGQNHGLLFAVCVNIIVQVKHMLHLTDGCMFPLTAKTAQTILHNEQSGLNTGLYNPSENIPLDLLNLICVRCPNQMLHAHFTHLLIRTTVYNPSEYIPLELLNMICVQCPNQMLHAHFTHLVIRLNFLSHKNWARLLGFPRQLFSDKDSKQSGCDSLVQTFQTMAYAEYFVENGITEAVHLSWLLVNRIHVLISEYNSCPVVQSLIRKVHETGGASALLLQAIAARCQHCLKGEFALNTFMILSLSHESQSGALVFLICRIIGKLEPSVAVRFAKLAIDRCQLLKELSFEKVNEQLSKEDLQVALELLQRDRIHLRYNSLVVELNTLASSMFDLSPLDLSQERSINPQYVLTTTVDDNWLLNQVKNRCCKSNGVTPKVSNACHLSNLLAEMSKEELSKIMSCPDFDRNILSSCFKVACDTHTREFLNVLSIIEAKEFETDNLRRRRNSPSFEMIPSVDSNKLNVLSTVQVFRKSDNKESKSQFFIPITEDASEKFGNLRICDEETEIIPPDMPDLYLVSLGALDKSLTDVIRLFPKQSRPLSQSENFSLNIEQTIDRYTRRCHQVFQDKLFYKEFVTIQTILTGFLESVQRILTLVDEADCDLLDKCIENILPSSLSKNLAVFSVISMQYLSFLIKNKSFVESPVHAEVSFRVDVITDSVVVDNVILMAVSNVAGALSLREVWLELNSDSNVNRIQSAVSCLYAVVKYLVKDTDPIVHQMFIQSEESPKPDIVISGNKLVTLIQFWEKHFYTSSDAKEVFNSAYRAPLETLLVSLSRLDIFSNIALIPPIAWSSVVVTSKKDELHKIDLPLNALQDMDVLEAFLFRVNLIGWVSKKQFEEIWVALLGALQGNGTHWAVRGITQLLVSAAPSIRGKGLLHVPRLRQQINNGMQLLRNILTGTSAYRRQFDDVNLERIAMANDGFGGYHCAQFSTEYLKLAADISDLSETSYAVRRAVKRWNRSKDIDINSCLQLLMDITTQMLDPKAPTGLAARVSLLNSIVWTSDVYRDAGAWCWAAHQLIAMTSVSHAALTQYSAAGKALLAALSRCLGALHGFDGLQELSTVHQKLLKSLSSNYAPLRQAALHGCLLQMTNRQLATQQEAYSELVTQLVVAVRQYLKPQAKISLYEQSIYWSVLFTLIELGHPDLIHVAVDFVLTFPNHYCIDIVVKGITLTIRQQVLPKELKNSVIEKLLDNMQSYSEHHAMQILMVHLFSADTKLLSPRLTSDVSNMDPDVLMNSMERITLLYKCLRQTRERESRKILTSTLKYFLRETLPPAATLSRVVIEFLECCKQTERMALDVLGDRERWVHCSVLNAEIVFEVFETAVSQDQLPVLSGWIFEALCHLLHGKISSDLLPYCVLTLLVSASSRNHIRKLCHLSYNSLKVGFSKNVHYENWNVFSDFLICNRWMSFNDRRLLCVISKHSDFGPLQLTRLKELCENNSTLTDLLNVLNA